MIRSDLYRRRTLLGNGDDGRRCRDAHKEGQTIEEKQKVSPGSWPHKIQVESGSIDPGFPRHNYANDLPPPASWFPPVFFFFAIPHNAQQTTVQRPASSHPTSPCSSYFPLEALTFIPSCDHFIYPLFLWTLAICLGPDRVPFSRVFRVESRSGVIWNVGSSPSGVCDGDRHLSLPQLMRLLV